MRVFPWAARATMPWRNGGGTTHELYRDDALRFSIAEVAAPGPFSTFPGVDRVIVLLDGEGCVLGRGAIEVALRPGAPFAFHGEDAWSCVRVEGRALDFNVMLRRDAGRASVWAARPGPLDAEWLLALGDGRVGAEAVARFDLVRLDGPTLLEVPGLAVRIA